MKKWLRYIVVVCGAAVAVIGVWLAAIMFLPPSLLYSSQIAQVEKYVSQLEAYKKEHGQYPDEKVQTIVPRQEHDNPFFYQGGNSAYRVGFRVGFDEAYYYESGSKKWSFEVVDSGKKKQ